MGKVIAQASMSLDGFIADTADEVGPLFDWYRNGDVEVTGSHPELVPPRPAPPICGRRGRASVSTGSADACST